MNNDIDFLLLQKRIVIIDGPIDDNAAVDVIAKLTYLNTPPYKDAYIFIDSPGGLVSPCFAIYDTLRWLKYEINTIGLKSTAAFATLLLAAGSKGKRYALSDSIILPSLHPGIGSHDVLDSGKMTTIHTVFDKAVSIYASLTNNDLDIMRAVCSTSHTLKADEACSYGYIDKIIGIELLGETKHVDYFDVVDLIQGFNKIEASPPQ